MSSNDKIYFSKSSEPFCYYTVTREPKQIQPTGTLTIKKISNNPLTKIEKQQTSFPSEKKFDILLFLLMMARSAIINKN